MYHGYCKMCILATQKKKLKNSIGRLGPYIVIPPTKKGCKNSQFLVIYLFIFYFPEAV